MLPASSPLSPVSFERFVSRLRTGDFTKLELAQCPGELLYFAIQRIGRESCTDLIADLTDAQYQTILDLEFWDGDRLCEDKLWDWLLLVDERESLAPIDNLLRAIDRKILAVLICRYVHVVIHEEPTEQPPGLDYFTPDKGFSWVALRIHNDAQRRIFGKILAFIFETNAELYYQLISHPQATTASELEEECFIEKTKRLLAAGIPDLEGALEVVRERSAQEVVLMLKGERLGGEVEFVGEIVTQSEETPFRRMVAELMRKNEALLVDQFEGEYARVLNAVLVYFKIQISEWSEVEQALEAVEGMVNIGIEEVSAISKMSAMNIYRAIGLQPLFQVGLQKIWDIRRIAAKIIKSEALGVQSSAPIQVILERLSQPFPMLPRFFAADGNWIMAQGELTPGVNALSRSLEVAKVREFLLKL